MPEDIAVQASAGLTNLIKKKTINKSVEDTQLEFCFWVPIIKGEGAGRFIQSIIIKDLIFYDLIYHLGFRRHDVGEENIFIHITNNRVIKRVKIVSIMDAINKFVSSLPAVMTISGLELDRNLIRGKVLERVNSLYNPLRLNSELTPKEPLIFNCDRLHVKYMYFNNGYLRIDKTDIKFKPYTELKGYIWDSEILKHDFRDPVNYKGKNYVKMFCHNISGKNESRFKSLQTIIGYYMHNFTDYKIKALMLTDSKIDEDGEANGQTGKTLLSRLIGGCTSNDPLDTNIKSFVEINGKDFNSKEKHKYSLCDLDTKLVIINDLPKYFDVDNLYNDVTEGISVDKKGLQSFKSRPKMIIITNKTVKIEGTSSKARFIEFEMEDFYNDVFTPEVDFGIWFFRDWSAEDYCQYYKFMAQCAQKFFINDGKMIEPEQINLDARKLLDTTCSEFVDYIENELQPEDGKMYNKQHLFSAFIKAYPDYDTEKFKQKKFTEWLKNYVRYHKEYKNFNKDENDKRDSDGTRYFIFIKKK